MNIEVDPLSAFISLIALIVSVVTAYSVFVYNKKKYELDAYFYGEGFFIEFERTLYKYPDALRFHGIEQKELDELGLTKEDFSYLLSNFTTGCLEIRVDNTPIDKVKLTEYRMRMLQSEATRKAWPLIKRMMTPSTCTDKIDEQIRLIEEQLSESQ